MALRETSKRGGEPVIVPLLDKKTKKPLTNIQIIRNMDKVLTALKDSKKPEDQIAFSKAIDNDMKIYDYIHEVASIDDDRAAQRRIEETLLPNPAMAKQLQQFEASAKAKSKK